MQQTYKVPDVSCGHCKSSIEGALQPLAGVQSASVDIDNKMVTVDFDDAVVDSARLVQAIEGAGYGVAS